MSAPLIPGQWYIAAFSSNRSVHRRDDTQSAWCSGSRESNNLYVQLRTDEHLSHDRDTGIEPSTSDITKHWSPFQACSAER